MNANVLDTETHWVPPRRGGERAAEILKETPEVGRAVGATIAATEQVTVHEASLEAYRGDGTRTRFAEGPAYEATRARIARSLAGSAANERRDGAHVVLTFERPSGETREPMGLDPATGKLRANADARAGARAHEQCEAPTGEAERERARTRGAQVLAPALRAHIAEIERVETHWHETSEGPTRGRTHLEVTLADGSHHTVWKAGREDALVLARGAAAARGRPCLVRHHRAVPEGALEASPARMAQAEDIHDARAKHPNPNFRASSLVHWSALVPRHEACARLRETLEGDRQIYSVPAFANPVRERLVALEDGVLAPTARTQAVATSHKTMVKTQAYEATGGRSSAWNDAWSFDQAREDPRGRAEGGTGPGAFAWAGGGWEHNGMTLGEWFEGMAAQGLAANPEMVDAGGPKSARMEKLTREIGDAMRALTGDDAGRRPAFAWADGAHVQDGMTRGEWYAGQTLAGLCANPSVVGAVTGRGIAACAWTRALDWVEHGAHGRSRAQAAKAPTRTRGAHER